ncbi:universal stress protein [Phytohalomonas tamaricis]|uniref:universal stress protein n=1 Tax=Phytohalomonas tamaricis TaxID=2081032 RepID=UPI000D0BB465|nr:universal stress protein [Phytohalomonas tamaricis]
MFKSLLVPIDGSDYALKALEVASQMVAAEGMLYLLTVRELLPPLHEHGAMSVEAAIHAASPEAAEKEGRALLDKAGETIAAYPGEVQTLIRMGSPARVIVKEADRLGVDAIVMGSRGLSDISGLIVGSVSHKVTHIANCMVISVHTKLDQAALTDDES